MSKQVLSVFVCTSGWFLNGEAVSYVDVPVNICVPLMDLIQLGLQWLFLGENWTSVPLSLGGILWFHFIKHKSRDSSVGIALGYGLDDRGTRVRFPAGMEIFLFTTASRAALGPTQPPIQWVPWALSLGEKRPGREADNSHPSSAEVKNAWSYTSTPPIRFHGVVLS
jgi:hypothetical protein